jgi:hypothetical protein
MTDTVRLKEIAEAAAERTIRKTLLLIGVDVSQPIEAQETFGVLRDVARMARDADFRKDLEHARTSRLLWESVRDKGIMTAVGLLIAGIAAALWAGFKNMLK